MSLTLFAADRPNIIVILADDQGFGDLGANNPQSKIATPNLDALAKGGLRFTDGHTSSGVCTPTRYSLLTGRYHWRTKLQSGVLGGFSTPLISRDRLTLAGLLKQQGYATGCFGKWHLGDEAEYQPNKRGFDEVFIHGAGGIGQSYPGSCGDVPKNSYYGPTVLHNGKFVKTDGYCTDEFFAQATKWIEGEAAAKRPFLAWVATNAPHGPVEAFRGGPLHYARQRGIAADTEFRYKERDYSGQLRLNLMPSDKLRNERRWGLSSQHNGEMDTGIDSIGRIGLGLTLNRVSDNNYWRDFPRSGSVLTQRILPSTGVLSWGRGDFSMSAQVQRWQNLQEAAPPYDRAPQITMRYGQWNAEGLDWSVVGDTTRFEADYSRVASLANTTPLNGERSFVHAQVSRPWIRPWGFVTPKLQLHATRYQMDRPLSNGESAVNRVLPTFSLDSGLVFERETRWFGRDVLQTLEPRAFYARTPYKNQDMLPLYDSGATDFNLSTIYSENTYVGQDRLADNDALTLGVNSRFFDAANGAEMLRVGVAQRIRFSDQQVVLPGQVASSAGLSDILFGAGIRWDDRWSFDATIQANNQTHDISRTTLQGRYNHSPYRVINVAYRANNQVTPNSEFVDVGWQWPLSDLIGQTDRQAETAWSRTPGQGLGPDRWYTVGRLNYSLKERSLVDTLVGLEYDAGCWLGRVAFQRLQTNTSSVSDTSATSRILFQLEFIGFARVGISPLKSLSDNIPRYQYLRDSTVQPSRFQHYE